MKLVLPRVWVYCIIFINISVCYKKKKKLPGTTELVLMVKFILSDSIKIL